MQRLNFTISTDTGGDYTDTGAAVTGIVSQIRLVGGSLDTGCDVRLESITTGVVIADYDNVGGQSWTRVPKIQAYDTGGTYVGDQSPLVNNEALRLTVNQSGGVTGSQTATLYVWLMD